MEGGSLFNPGFLGSNFLWWVGQIADDSTWRDNINAGKYPDKDSIPGWGRRYKVRIIGLHDQGQETIPDDQLPWANVMYPITAGGGQTASKATPNLRQGNMVFGFFLDGQDQQVPVIMGVLGNNSQTVLNQKIGTSRVTNTTPGTLATSGYADGASPPKGSARPTPPASDLAVKQPAKRKAASQEAGPGAAPAPGATNENSDGIHQSTSADTKRQAKCDEKIVLLKPDPQEHVPSALKGIQTAIDNLTTKIDSYLQALQSYADAVTNVISDLQALMKSFAEEMAKYMKVIFDKVMEFVVKTLNKALTKVVAALPSSMRYQFSDMKQVFTDLVRCLYSKMTDGLGDKILGALTGAIDLPELIKEATDRATKGEDENGYPSGATTNPYVPMCTAETITAQVLAGSRPEIDDANNNLVGNLNSYLDDVNDTLAGIADVASLLDVKNLIPDIGGSLTSALSFTNIKLNVFGCEATPTVAASDFYTFCQGGDAQTEAETPSAKSVDEKTKEQSENGGGIEDQGSTPYVEPNRSTPNVNNKTSGGESDIDQALEDSQNNAPVQEGDLELL
ncbi:MAG: hypothetical protein CMA57_04100 [Euryarchaeota archaeon]|nr:hypothetical protein [Euryarchaeota archaeon]